jgi:DNA-3-methyladenine glycosylase
VENLCGGCVTTDCRSGLGRASTSFRRPQRTWRARDRRRGRGLRRNAPRALAGCRSPLLPGITSRNAVTFWPPGRFYTYRSHGIHVCANVSCGPDGTAAAVLLRAAAVRDGEHVARSRRGATGPSYALARGPGNLCSTLGITMDDNGINLFGADSPVTLRPADNQGAVSVRGSGLVRPPTGRGAYGLRGTPKSPLICEARGRLPRATATSLNAPGAYPG